MFLVHAEDWPEVARAHGEVFADIRPASTAVVVKALLDTRWRVEVEADAVSAGMKQIYPNSITGTRAPPGGQRARPQVR